MHVFGLWDESGGTEPSQGHTGSCCSPVMDWQPAQDVSCLSPCDSWNKGIPSCHHPPPSSNPELDVQLIKRMDEWMFYIMVAKTQTSTFFLLCLINFMLH